MKLNTIVTLKGVICLKTGLHIGAGKDNIEIGGPQGSSACPEPCGTAQCLRKDLRPKPGAA